MCVIPAYLTILILACVTYGVVKLPFLYPRVLRLVIIYLSHAHVCHPCDSFFTLVRDIILRVFLLARV